MKICRKATVIGAAIVMAAALGVLISVAARGHINQSTETINQAQISNTTARPITFIANQGQWDSKVAFIARRSGMTAWLLKDGITFQFEKRISMDHAQGVTLQMTFENASACVSLAGEERQLGRHHFFIGNDRSKWQNDVPGYSHVIYRGLYEGIDLRLREDNGWLEYDLLLSEGADLSDLVVCCEGLKGLRVDDNGILVMETEYGTITQRPAKAWYEPSTGERIPVDCNFRLIDDERYGFEVERDLGLTLIIDPGLEWSTFLGGSESEEALAVAVNASGDVIVTGFTNSDDFPVTPGAYNTVYGGGSNDGFVSCISANGSQLLWSTYLGGSEYDVLFDLDIDDSGRTTVVGLTNSPDFPATPGAYDTSHNGDYDAVITRLNADGSQLIYSTFLGASADDWSVAIEVDGSNRVFVGGYTGSSNFPTTASAYDTSYNGGSKDAFIVCLNADGSNLLYSTYLGGSGVEGWAIQSYLVNTRIMGLALDNSGELIITGYTNSLDFPTTPAAYDTTQNGFFDVFVTRLNATGSDLVYSTFLGGALADGSFSSEIGLDASGAVTIAGVTQSSDFPVTPGAYDTTYNGTADVFVCRLDPTGSNLLYSTFIGGNGWDDATSCVLDPYGDVIVTGSCQPGYPVTPGAYDTTYNGGMQDGYISRLRMDGNGQSDLRYSTFLGGSGAEWDYGNALALVADSAVIVGGRTQSMDFPITPGAYDTSYSGPIEGFVCRLSPYVGIEEGTTYAPQSSITLSPVYPNPSQNAFSYEINLTASSRVKLFAVDVTGRLVEILMDGFLPAGIHEFSWRPKEKLASGIYFIKLLTDEHSETRKVLLVK